MDRNDFFFLHLFSLIGVYTSVDLQLLIYNLYVFLYFHTIHLCLFLKGFSILLVNSQYNYIVKPEILNYDFLWRYNNFFKKTKPKQ